MLINDLLSYNLREYRRHGEAGSVNLEAVKAKHERISKILADYPKKDWVNFNESGLFRL
jgi:hypothetical protein